MDMDIDMEGMASNDESYEPPSKKKRFGDHCSAFDCNHKRSDQNCSFLSFPSNAEWKKKWVVAMGRLHVEEDGKVNPDKLWEPKDHHRLCTCHFSEPPDPRKRKAGWNHRIPDLCRPEPRKEAARGLAKARTDRMEARTLKSTVVQSSTPVDYECVQNEAPELEPDQQAVPLEYRHVEVMHDYQGTKRSGRLAEALDELRAKYPETEELFRDYDSSKGKAEEFDSMLEKNQILCLSTVKSNDSLFKFYTNLPSYEVFYDLYQYLEPLARDMQYVQQLGKEHHSVKKNLKPGKKRAMTTEEEMFLTLVRLRLGLPSQDLATRFGIAESTFSNIFNTWTILLSRELEKICSMPSTEKTAEIGAPCFDNFPGTRVVLDCTEVFSQTPQSLTAHKHIHSNYKHHSTVKFLVGMSPSGAIVYVSQMWGGHASDKKITQEASDLLDSLDPGNKVMVDKGFRIEEDLPSGVKLIIPAFKSRGQSQFTREQLEYSEKIAMARIHVERAMRAIKEYRLLEFEVKLAMINNYEHIFKACAFLVNFEDPFLKCIRPK